MNTTTEGPLPRLSLSNNNRPLDFFIYKIEEGRLEMDQAYQRGLVWGEERKRNLIRSLLMGLPIGAVTLNNRLMAGFKGSNDYAVIDGKQRITAMMDFMADQFSVPVSWFPAQQVEQEESEGQVRWSGLSAVAHRRFQNAPVATNEAQVATVAEETVIFNLINFGGVAQGDSDL